MLTEAMGDARASGPLPSAALERTFTVRGPLDLRATLLVREL